MAAFISLIVVVVGALAMLGMSGMYAHELAHMANTVGHTNDQQETLHDVLLPGNLTWGRVPDSESGYDGHQMERQKTKPTQPQMNG
jgi:hypothetical protein